MSISKIKKLGKYDIIREIGRGSMGRVYLGYDPYVNREVAIKVALSEIVGDKSTGVFYRRMFFNEARVAGLLDHPNIVPVYDAGTEGNYCYLVMDYIKGGKTIRDYCAVEKLLPVEKVIEIIFKCAKALDYAHRKGVIHRDIKPGNIMLTEDMDVKVCDFSIARMSMGEETQFEGIMGSPKYMSPEQINDAPLGNQTDLYSLGVVAYEMLTGVPPFDADNISTLVHKILNRPHVPLRTHRPSLPAALDDVVSRMLKKDPAERYSMGLDLSADLARIFKNLKFPENELREEGKFLSLKKLAFFGDFNDSEVWEVVRASHWLNYEPGLRIIAEGDFEDSFYILVQGSVEVLKANKVLSTLVEGDCFGEMGYLSKSRRTATIVSITDVTLLKVSGTLMEHTSVGCQLRFSRVFVNTLITRLTRTSEEISRGCIT
jgi:serine/threonine protein kinase